ncbi:Non-capsid protein NS-1 [Fasciola hepatica]|uniref:Non-capsid protein NS-1 n=1 Tax=Fasciola hepatica TaxID=6192 RepID=A0A4E0RG95_FASHE|nr:Non-capsid protein NS-1 [Fasciola hepatica]
MIIHLVEHRDARSLKDLKQKLTMQERMDIYTEFGIQWTETAKKTIEAYTEQLVRLQKQQPFLQYIQSNHHQKECEHPTTEQLNQGSIWLDQLLYENNINNTQIKHDIISIIDKHNTRINAFVLQGPPTTGKSLLLRLITRNYHYDTIHCMERNFQFQNLADKTIALVEEPRITPTQVDNFKKLLEGDGTLDVQVKHSGDVRLPRIPIFISTNHDLGKYVDNIDRMALYERCIVYNFEKRIGTDIPKPPHRPCACH